MAFGKTGEENKHLESQVVVAIWLDGSYKIYFVRNSCLLDAFILDLEGYSGEI